MSAQGRATGPLVSLATLGLLGSLVGAAGWWRAVHRAAHGPPSPASSAAERAARLGDLLALSPGLFVPALFEPDVGYTLRPDTRLTAYGHTFVANDLGYRTAPSGKPPDTFRVLFVGDSWTFGMGVAGDETFAAGVEALARGRVGPPAVQAWVLALPGYNMLNEVAALETLFERLAPDAVVFCPTSNDADSTLRVLPNGSTGYPGFVWDNYGGGTPLVYRSRVVPSFEFLDRWRRGMAALAAAAERLRARGVPLLVFFTGSWLEPFAHELMAGAGLDAPYLITPRRLTGEAWRNPPPYGHPTPRAHRLYAELAYAGLAELLGWPAIPAGEAGEAQLFRRAKVAWEGPSDAAATRLAQAFPADWEPDAEHELQAVGPLEPGTGLFARRTAVVVRASAPAGLLVELAAAEGVPSLYPLEVQASVPSAAGGSAVSGVLAPGAPLLLVVPLPPDRAPGDVLDLHLEAGRAALRADGVAASARLVRVGPAP